MRTTDCECSNIKNGRNGHVSTIDVENEKDEDRAGNPGLIGLGEAKCSNGKPYIHVTERLAYSMMTKK